MSQCHPMFVSVSFLPINFRPNFSRGKIVSSLLLTLLPSHIVYRLSTSKQQWNHFFMAVIPKFEDIRARLQLGGSSTVSMSRPSSLVHELRTTHQYSGMHTRSEGDMHPRRIVYSQVYGEYGSICGCGCTSSSNSSLLAEPFVEPRRTRGISSVTA